MENLAMYRGITFISGIETNSRTKQTTLKLKLPDPKIVRRIAKNLRIYIYIYLFI